MGDPCEGQWAMKWSAAPTDSMGSVGDAFPERTLEAGWARPGRIELGGHDRTPAPPNQTPWVSPGCPLALLLSAAGESLVSSNGARVQFSDGSWAKLRVRRDDPSEGTSTLEIWAIEIAESAQAIGMDVVQVVLEGPGRFVRARVGPAGAGAGCESAPIRLEVGSDDLFDRRNRWMLRLLLEPESAALPRSEAAILEFVVWDGGPERDDGGVSRWQPTMAARAHAGDELLRGMEAVVTVCQDLTVAGGTWLRIPVRERQAGRIGWLAASGKGLDLSSVMLLDGGVVLRVQPGVEVPDLSVALTWRARDPEADAASLILWSPQAPR